MLEWLGLQRARQTEGPARSSARARATAARCETLNDRLRVVNGRRFPALETVLAAWLVLLLVLGLVADRRGMRARRCGSARWRCMWLLSVLLVHRRAAPWPRRSSCC